MHKKIKPASFVTSFAYSFAFNFRKGKRLLDNQLKI